MTTNSLTALDLLDATISTEVIDSTSTIINIDLPDGPTLAPPVEITSFVTVPPWRGSPHTCPSDRDYYGYTEVEWKWTDLDAHPTFSALMAALSPADLARFEEKVEAALLGAAPRLG